MHARPVHELTVAEAARRLADGSLTSVALVEALLARIATEEPRIQAWQFLDPERARAQARRADHAWPPGAPGRPPLAGVPIGVKDIVATSDMPTECGSPLRQGHRPSQDAACVAALRGAGAVVLGKTVTTEFALFTPGKTRNPWNPAHTPGGSSSGSAAAVAACMVPGAVGSQTAGSVIRPASFCGVVGLKPSYGLLPMAGVEPQAPSLDTLGVFARDVADLPLLVAGCGGPRLDATPLDRPPRLALCRTEAWPRAGAEARRAAEEALDACRRAGATVSEVELGPAFDGLSEAQRVIQTFEVARSLARERAEAPELLSERLRAILDEGAAIAPERHRVALELAARCRAAVGAAFAGTDALVTPGATGAAPAGLDSTGDPAMNRVWTALHLPCVSLPAGVDRATGLPVGVQLVGPPAGDALLLRVAAWASAARRPT